MNEELVIAYATSGFAVLLGFFNFVLVCMNLRLHKLNREIWLEHLRGHK